jgi:hypothetical protein
VSRCGVSGGRVVCLVNGDSNIPSMVFPVDCSCFFWFSLSLQCIPRVSNKLTPKLCQKKNCCFFPFDSLPFTHHLTHTHSMESIFTRSRPRTPQRHRRQAVSPPPTPTTGPRSRSCLEFESYQTEEEVPVMTDHGWGHFVDIAAQR